MNEPKELYDKEVDCPVCSNEFTTKKVRTSRLRLVKRDEDFLSYYNIENPIKYNILVCPNCGYANYENKFHEIRSKEIDLVKENILPKWNKRDFGGVRSLDKAIETYKLALINSTLINSSKLQLGNVCLNLAWLYRLKEEDNRKDNEEERFIILSRDNFIKAYNMESLSGSNMDEGKLSYLIGELSRRIGDREEALSWFNTSLSLESTKMNPAIDNIVREQWRITKEDK